MYCSCLLSHSVADDISVRCSHRMPASVRGSYLHRDDGTRYWSGDVSRYETHQNRFTDLCSTRLNQRTGQGLHYLSERPSSNVNCYRSQGHQYRYSHSSTNPSRFDTSSGWSTNRSDNSHDSSYTRTFHAPIKFVEESQCSHKIGWCVTQMSKWHVTLLSGWASTHMADCYFNLFTEGPIKYFNQVDLTHKFKLKATKKCCVTDSSSNKCDEECTSDEIDDVIATFVDQHPDETREGSDITLSNTSDDHDDSSNRQQCKENVIEKRFKEILDTLNKDVASNGDITLEQVTLSCYTNNASPKTTFSDPLSKPSSDSPISYTDSNSTLACRNSRNHTELSLVLDCKHPLSYSSTNTVSQRSEIDDTCSQLSEISSSTVNRNNGADHCNNQSLQLHLKPEALTYTGRSSSMLDYPRLAEIPTEGVRIHRQHRGSTWRDAVSTAWREGMSASWRNAPPYSRCSPHSLVPMGETTNTVLSSDVKYSTLRDETRDFKYSTLRDEVSLKLSAVYNMGVQVTRAIIGRRTEVHHSPTTRL